MPRASVLSSLSLRPSPTPLLFCTQTGARRGEQRQQRADDQDNTEEFSGDGTSTTDANAAAKSWSSPPSGDSYFPASSTASLTDRDIIMREESYRPGRKEGNADLAWNRKFEQLSAFKRVYGHLAIPNSLPALKGWISQQRVRYWEQKDEGLTNSLTKSRMKRLESLGIAWRVKEEVWEGKYQELKQYKEIHGHTSLPPDHHLYHWAHLQRKYYGFPPPRRLADERITKLNQLDFVWELQEAAWDVMYNKLVEFHSIHGHW